MSSPHLLTLRYGYLLWTQQVKTIKFDFCSQIKPESSVAKDKSPEHLTDQEMPRTCHLRYSLTSGAWAGLHYDQGHTERF